MKKNKLRHVLGISGGKDSAALAIYLNQNYPEMNIEYYFCDTDKELDETYEFLEKLEVYLGKRIQKLEAVKQSPKEQFDHFLELYGGFLPSSTARWCTKKLKLEPFENFVNDDNVISYVGIRGDEDRDGYISKKSTIQSIFPFRRNIWSEDVTNKILSKENESKVRKLYRDFTNSDKLNRIDTILKEDSSFISIKKKRKIEELLEIDTVAFNHVTFEILKEMQYPLTQLEEFSLLNNTDVLVKNDIFNILEESGIGLPEYYKRIEFEHNGEKGYYSRSRSGCYFCFFQQKIEWVWLFENHPELFKKAMEYEKEGYSWMDSESLEDLIKPERIAKIKEDQLKKLKNEKNKKSSYLVDILDEDEADKCVACFV